VLHRSLSLAALFAFSVTPALAQPETVPAEHPVYAFLHQQRTAGHLPEYRHEMRPLARAAVQDLLDSLTTRRGERDFWLRDFRQEFFEPDDAIQAVLGDGPAVRLPFGRRTEKFLFYRRSDRWRVAVQTEGRAQARWGEGRVLPEDSTSTTAERVRNVAFLPTLTVQGHYGDHVGFYTSTFNGQVLAGDARALQDDPALAPLYYIGRQRNPPGSFDRSTASFRLAGGPFAAEIAHARLLAGTGPSDPLVLAGAADYFSHVRLSLDTRYVSYDVVHGALGDRSVRTPDGNIVGPERYLALHRLDVRQARWLSLGFSEMVVYGQRGPELAYLNPVNPFKPAEHALWDCDNTLFALDAVVRPLRGVELYGTFLADDLDFSMIGEGSYNNKWAVQAGAGFGLDTPAGAAHLFAEYARVQPFTYTHRFDTDGSFYNSYQHNGYTLGLPIGPNADRVLGGARLWLPFRLRLEGALSYTRRGENFLGADGAVVNVGGDPRDGDQPPFTELTNVFLAGEVFRGIGASAGLTWEPLNEMGVRLAADVQQWDGDQPDRLFVLLETFVSW
jgi:hypothetical protein